MITENLSTLKIHKLTQAQYDRALAAGKIDANALYLTPDEDTDLSQYATIEQLSSKADIDHTHTLDDLGVTATTEELNYVDGVTSNIQTQLNNLNRWVQSCNNTDMNTVKTTGFYFGYTGMTHACVQTISVWEVIAYSPDWVVQRQTVINSDGSGDTYERRFYGGNTWSNWKVIGNGSGGTGGTTNNYYYNGMGQEFYTCHNADKCTPERNDGNSKTITTTVLSDASLSYSYTTPSNLSKIYNIGLRCRALNGDPDGVSSNNNFNSITVGYNEIVNGCEQYSSFQLVVPCYHPFTEKFDSVRIKITYDSTSKKLTFSSSNQDWELYSIRGLY